VTLRDLLGEEHGDVLKPPAAVVVELEVAEALELRGDLGLLLVIKLAIVDEQGCLGDLGVEVERIIGEHLWLVPLERGELGCRGRRGGWLLEEDVASPGDNELLVRVRQAADTRDHRRVAPTGVDLPFGVDALERRRVLRLEFRSDGR
jgi:hypothetical protein